MFRHPPNVATLFSTTAVALAALVLLPVAPAALYAAAPKTTACDIATNPPGAKVVVVGPPEIVLGVTPLKKAAVPQGSVQLRFTLDGYEDLLQPLVIDKKSQNITLNLVRKIKPGTIELSGGPESNGAKVTIDGQDKGVMPTSAQVPPGRHQVIIAKTGFDTWEKWVEVGEGQKAAYEVVLKQTAKPKGTLAVTSTPTGAEFSVNGSARGKTPAVVPNLDPADYIVEVKADGFKPKTIPVHVEEGKQAVVDAQLEANKSLTGEIKVLCDVKGATIFLDGDTIGLAPVSKGDVRPGTHVVEARADGLPTVKKSVEVKAGEQTVVEIGLGEAAAAAAKSQSEAVARTFGGVRIVANVPGCQASIDSGAAKPVPVLRNDLTAGKHFVIVSREGYAPWNNEFEVKIGATTDVAAVLIATGKLIVTVPLQHTADVSVDGKFMGNAGVQPLTLDLAAGTYKVTVKDSATGVVEERSVIIPEQGQAKFEAALVVPEKTYDRRQMPFSAFAMKKTHGAVDLGLNWPYVAEVRMSGGIVPNLDAGLTIRNATNTITEFEIRGKYTLLQSDAFGVGADVGVFGGLGSESRSSFGGRLALLASLNMGDVATLTLHTTAIFFIDRISADAKRDGGALLYVGLAPEFKVADKVNLFLRFDYNPLFEDTLGGAGHRLLLDQGLFGTSKNSQMRGGAGISILF